MSAQIRTDRSSGASRSTSADSPRPDVPGRPSRKLLWVVFSLPAFGSAFLVFWIEPSTPSFCCPSSGALRTALMFYQAALLAGYLYAHVGVRLLGPRRQAALHLAVVVAVLAVLPVAAPSAAGAVDRPVVWVLGTLTFKLGLTFVALATTAPLLQRWLAAVDGSGGIEPYRLYAVSNAGSFGALLAFPFLLEPLVPAGEQLLGWSWSAGLVAVPLLWLAPLGLYLLTFVIAFGRLEGEPHPLPVTVSRYGRGRAPREAGPPSRLRLTRAAARAAAR